jgi:prevent-host-death family protein
MRSIPAARFKAQCLKLLDQVAESGETIVVTKRGRPIARLAPIEEPRSLVGSVTFLVSDEELMEPILEPWDVEQE